MSQSPLATVVFGRMAPTVGVRSIDTALAFYRDVLGFRVVFQNGDPVGFVVLKKDAAELHLSLQRDHAASVRNVAHLFVGDVQAVYAACVAANIRIVKGLAGKEYGQDAFVFADPDGNRIDVGQRT